MLKSFSEFVAEEVPTNATSSGAVAGTTGEPPVPLAGGKPGKLKKKSIMLHRPMPEVRGYTS